MSTPDDTKDDRNVSTVNDATYGYRIIIVGFSLVAALAGLAIYLPANANQVEFAVSGAIGGILGFLAGRKKQ